MPSNDVIFLCYDPRDEPKVVELTKQLESTGLDIVDGQNAARFDEHFNLEQAIRISRFVIICLSQNLTSTSPDIQRQLEAASVAAQSKPIDRLFLIPVRLDG